MIPAPDRELVLRWMESSGGFDVIDIVHQVAVKAAAWGWMQQESKPLNVLPYDFQANDTKTSSAP